MRGTSGKERNNEKDMKDKKEGQDEKAKTSRMCN
jgi:hypothetical protein